MIVKTCKKHGPLQEGGIYRYPARSKKKMVAVCRRCRIEYDANGKEKGNDSYCDPKTGEEKRLLFDTFIYASNKIREFLNDT